ncbi:MAG: FkbM family methyltransferase [Deltaproteobacteria bacterium]|nr:FkbM family methyltransferase [Deltaproteobacteria bacterium]
MARWVIDVGAGRGELICLSARRTKILKIVAVEPLTAMYDLIVEHLRINGLLNDPRISILTKYVSSVPNKNIDTVLLDSIDVPVGEHGFLKIDVDGAEMDVLMSGQQLLKKWPVDVLVETHSQVLEKSCADFLKKLGYKVELIKNAWWRFILPEQRPIEHNRWLCGYK